MIRQIVDIANVAHIGYIVYFVFVFVACLYKQSLYRLAHNMKCYYTVKYGDYGGMIV